MAEEKIVIVPERPYANHGNTVAAWVMVAIMTVGVLVGSIAYDLGSQPVVFVGAGIIVIGLLVGFFLKQAGYGQGGKAPSSTEYVAACGCASW